MLTCAVISNPGVLAYRTCMGMGPNYYRTFDGLEFLFSGRCTYNLLEIDSLSIRISVKMINCHSYVKCRKVSSDNNFLNSSWCASWSCFLICLAMRCFLITGIMGLASPLSFGNIYLDHITPAIHTLHLLPVSEEIWFKLVKSVAFKATSHLASSLYMVRMLQVHGLLECNTFMDC